MNTEQYKALSNRLRTMDDVKRIAREEGYSEEMLLVIYTQRVTRGATKNFYRVKARAGRLLKDWESGTPLIVLARRHRFPPVLMAYIIMMERRIGRKTFWKYVRGTDSIPNKRLRREIKEVVRKDKIYSPEGNEVATKRGRDGETQMARFLDKFKISYLTEKDLRGQSSKTPDFLLDKPISVDGRPIYWIESKANFGDLVEVRRNGKKQLVPYVKLFGPGMVVYWFGYVSDAPQDDDIMMVDDVFIEKVFSKEGWGKRVRVLEKGDEAPEPEVEKEADRAKEAKEKAQAPGPGPKRKKKGRRRRRRRRRRGRGKRGKGKGNPSGGGGKRERKG